MAGALGYCGAVSYCGALGAACLPAQPAATPAYGTRAATNMWHGSLHSDPLWNAPTQPTRRRAFATVDAYSRLGVAADANTYNALMEVRRGAWAGGSTAGGRPQQPTDNKPWS